ncbi:MAG TPA: ribonuclease E inhibitor RraB [Steroidobacteraceae bacterium]|nr:ribonuclease E inhibitor RraB [Steroidobacteraceae bacterium]
MLVTVLAFVVAGGLIVGRIYFKIRKIQGSRAESWDARMIEQLRSKGYAPFNDYKVDFFLALPDESACGAVRTRLEQQGFSVDTRPMPDTTELPFSLHATKLMRLIVPDIQAQSRRMTDLATEFHGRYDGWAA